MTLDLETTRLQLKERGGGQLMPLKLLSNRTPHPCAGMTPAQRRDFELIAINERPRGGVKTLKALKEAGLIEQLPPKIVGRDALGLITVPDYCVPLTVHLQWCKWASEQPTDTGGVT